MIPRLRCVSVALFALLTGASACLAAEPGYAPHWASVGGGFGVSKFAKDADYSAGAALRFSFGGSFRYVMNPWLRWQVSPGFTWTAYTIGTPAPFLDPQFPADVNKDRYLTLLVPVSAQLQLVQKRGWWLYHLGVGPSINRMWIENRRKVLEDPISHRRHRGEYLGASAELGAERFLRNLTTTSVEGTLGGHLVFAERDKQFPAGFNSKALAIEARMSVNYYFDLSKPKKSAQPGIPKTP
jgi:hypothetical protein